MHSPGALHFKEQNETIINCGLQTNSTTIFIRGKIEDPTFKFQLPFQLSAQREISRFLIKGLSCYLDNGQTQISTFNWTVGLIEFSHPPTDPFSAMESIGPTFSLAVAMFGFVFQISALLTEKELKLRQTAFAFTLSAFINQESSATNIGFYNFIVGLIIQVVTQFGFLYNDRFAKGYKIIWSFPPNLLAKALKMLTNASTTHRDPGISWSGRTKCSPNGDDCIVTMNDIFI